MVNTCYKLLQKNGEALSTLETRYYQIPTREANRLAHKKMKLTYCPLRTLVFEGHSKSKATKSSSSAVSRV